MSSVRAMRAAVSPWRQLANELAANPAAVLALLLLGAIVLLAILAPTIASQVPLDLARPDLSEARLPPGSKTADDGRLWLGTDTQGRDLFAAILHGLRISLLVGAACTVPALAIGLALGLSAACVGGSLEALLMRVVDIQLSFPALLIALILMAVLGQGTGKVIAVLAFVQWAHYARAAIGAARVEKRKAYIEAARCLALPPLRIVLRHLLPNCLPPLTAVATAGLAGAIALEATLSFLGLGLPANEASLGLLIANGYQDLLSGRYWISFFPGVALLLTIVSINLVADRLQEVVDPRLQK